MKILIVDDHSLFRDGLASLLEAADHDVVAQVGNGEEAVEVVLEKNPDLVLLDIAMPKMNGLEALQQIKSHAPCTRVVMLTVSDDDNDLVNAIKLGADGYLLKDLDSQEFLESLNGVEQGNIAITRKTATQLINGYQKMLQHTEDEKEVLSGREMEILGLIAKGMSTSHISLKLYISENTVKYHVRNILQKLDAHNRAEAIANAGKMGLIEN